MPSSSKILLKISKEVPKSNPLSNPTLLNIDLFKIDMETILLSSRVLDLVLFLIIENNVNKSHLLVESNFWKLVLRDENCFVVNEVPLKAFENLKNPLNAPFI